MFGAGVQRVSDNVSLINELNVFPVPDGDTGINLFHTLQCAWQEISGADEDAVCVVAKRFAYGALMGARGNSGTILSQLLTGFADHLSKEKLLTAPLLMDACNSAVARAYAAVSQPVEGTILTVAREAAEGLHSSMSLDEMLETMVNAAQISLDNTPNLLPLLKDAGVVDAGGMGLLCFLQGIQLHHRGATHDIASPALRDSGRPSLLPSPDETYGYDVQFLMLGEALEVNDIRRQMEQLGWSVIVVGDAAAIKVHVHVENPALPLDYAIQSGAVITDVVVENMQLQATEFANRYEPPATETAAADVAVIAVAEGEGMHAVLRDLGCAWIIDGGAGKNPATEDFVTAIDRVSVEKVIILPNDKNVVMAAQQAAKLRSERQVKVVATRTVLQGINATIAFGDASDKDVSLDTMTAAMEAACAGVNSIEITRATRSARLNGLDIQEKDFIAIIDGSIAVATADIETTLGDALLSVGLENKELVTLYYGEDLGSDFAKRLIEHLLITIKGIDFETIYGGQALYPLLVSVE